MTRALPKFDQILLMTQEECTKFIENCSCMNLVQMGWWVENLFSHVNWICDDNDFWNIVVICSLIDTTSDSKQFSFCACDVNCMIKSFCNRSVVDVCVRYRCCNVVFNTSIHNNNCMQRNTWRFESQVVQLLNIGFEVSCCSTKTFALVLRLNLIPGWYKRTR